MIHQKFTFPTKKQFRDMPKYKGMSWDDAFGWASCEGCGKFFQPGETITFTGYRKGYHKQCLPKEE